MRKYIVDIAGGLPTILLEIERRARSLQKTYIWANGEILARHNGDYSAAKEENQMLNWRTKNGGFPHYSSILTLLLAISIIGLVLSAVIHVCFLFHIFRPPRELVMVIDLGIVAVLYPAYIISQKMRNTVCVEDFKKTLFNACPKWLSIITGLLIIYALAGLVCSAFIRYFPGSGSSVATGEVTTDNALRGFSGHWMALYSLALALLYSCRRLRK